LFGWLFGFLGVILPSPQGCFDLFPSWMYWVFSYNDPSFAGIPLCWRLFVLNVPVSKGRYNLVALPRTRYLPKNPPHAPPPRIICPTIFFRVPVRLPWSFSTMKHPVELFTFCGSGSSFPARVSQRPRVLGSTPPSSP